jgi:c-di-GMP-binding flagellar brake protein YcgR
VRAAREEAKFPMPLTYDQKSEIRIAFDEAYVPADRRRDLRVKYRVEAQICSWQNNKQGVPFTVRIEDFSPSGVGLIHTAPLDLGSEYLIKVPRPNAEELIVLLTVARCKQQEDGTYLVGLELSSVMDRSHMASLLTALSTRNRAGKRRLRWLVIMFGVIGIGASLLVQYQ